MKIGKIILTTVAASILKIIWGFFTCGWLFNWVYRIEPSGLWKTPAQMPLGLMNATEFVFTLLLVLVYALIQKSLPKKGIVKGLVFGICVWLVGALPGISMMGMCTVMAPAVTVYLLLNSFVISLLQGVVIVMIYDRECPCCCKKA